MMDAKAIRNMYSILVVVNKHNTARVASCWFIIYYKMCLFRVFKLFMLSWCQYIVKKVLALYDVMRGHIQDLDLI